jgi:hypothetical protein
VNTATAEPRRTARGHLHVEAFCLMWYACRCGHRERIWNSRDGVTPFAMLCPSCEQPNLQHVDWKLDQYAPQHKPAPGQRQWVDMTRERAERYVRGRLASMKSQGYTPEATFEQLVDQQFTHGVGPDLVVTGYVDEEPAS